MTSDYVLTPIGTIRSPIKEKFGIARQSGLIPEHQCHIEIHSPFNTPDAFRGLEGFSHLWLIFLFHKNLRQQWRPMIRPPRMGGNKRIGVFASRSSFRPNSLGLSAVELLDIQHRHGRIQLKIGGADLIDGTPIIDIKPYLPFADAIPLAHTGYVDSIPGDQLQVRFSLAAQASLERTNADNYPDLLPLLARMLAQDPRPAYQKTCDAKSYGLRLFDLNIRVQITGPVAEVVSIDRIEF